MTRSERRLLGARTKIKLQVRINQINAARKEKLPDRRVFAGMIKKISATDRLDVLSSDDESAKRKK
jgi:hypothetical protein